MTTKSKAYSKFERTIRRSKTLIRTYSLLVREGRRNRRLKAQKDLLRAAVVLSVAAFDAYVTDVFVEKLVKYIKSYRPDDLLIDILSESGLDTRETLNLLKMERPFRRVRTLVEKYYDVYTTQKFRVVDQLFLAYRLKNISKRSQEKSGRKTLKRSIELLIARRHKIVHDGDYNAHGNLNKINVDQISKRIDDLKLFVSCMDEIIDNRI